MDTLVRTEATRYVHQMFDAIKDKVGYMDARMMLRHRASDAFMEGRYVIIYRLEVQRGAETYYEQEEVPGDLQEQGYWAAQESAVWRRLCIKMYAKLAGGIEGFREGPVLPAWLA
jgi:hypothetical protein